LPAFTCQIINRQVSGSETRVIFRGQIRGLINAELRPGHRPEIMFGVLVVVLRGDRIAGPGLCLGKREIALVISLRVVRTLRGWARRV
jgi:hypothetical protein